MFASLYRTVFYSWLSAVAAYAQIPSGAIATIAGTGVNGYSDGSGAASSAQIDMAYDVAVDPWGNLYVADSWNHRIRKVAPDGSIKVFAGNGTQGFSGDFGQAAIATLSFPRALATDAFGNVYFSDSGNGVIRKILTSGVIQTLAGNRQIGFQGDGGLAIQASFRVPRGIAVDARGNVFIADSFNARIRKIGTDGKVSTFAGTGQFGYSGDGGLATVADIGFVQMLAIDGAGNVYFTESSNHSVRRVRVDGVIETIAGTRQADFSGDDGPPSSATLNRPRGLAIDQLGAIYVADSANNRIRRIKNGKITTVAGTGTAEFGGDQDRAEQATLNYPYGITADPRGNLYIADLLNYRVRKARFETLQVKPAITQQSAVNAASFLPRLSSGGLISVFGTNFGYGQSAAAALPLAPSLAGTSVIVNGKPVPLVFASTGQINAQLPWSGLTSPVKLKVNFGGLESDEISVPISTASPGIFTYGANRAVVQNQDSSLNAAGNAAIRGSTIVIYATGLGPVSPSQSDGSGAPASPIARTSAVTAVSIGGLAARVTFSGLTPGFVGLWQVNAEVPANAPIGSGIPVKILVSGGDSNEAMIALK